MSTRVVLVVGVLGYLLYRSAKATAAAAQSAGTAAQGTVAPAVGGIETLGSKLGGFFAFPSTAAEPNPGVTSASFASVFPSAHLIAPGFIDSTPRQAGIIA